MVYFVAKFDQPFLNYGIRNGTGFTEKLQFQKSDNLIINLSFNQKENNNVINVKIGVSYVSKRSFS